MHVRARDRAGRRHSITARAALALLVAIVVIKDSGTRTLSAQASSTPGVFFSDLTWRCIGPFDGGPIASVQGVAGVPGAYTITTPTGGTWQTLDGGDSWMSRTESLPEPRVVRPGDDGGRDWTDPANPRRIARVSTNGIEVSLNGGQTWMAASHHLPIADVARLEPRETPRSPGSSDPGTERRIDGAAVTVSIKDPARPGLIFAGTKSGVFVSFDSGTAWTSIQLNMPAVAINDLDIRGRDLIAATQGRSTWLLADITPLRQLNASNASSPALLFAPADATLPRAEATDDAGTYIDYYLGPTSGDVTLEVLDASGRVVHRAQSVAPDTSDKWLPVMRPLPTSAGHHRIVWNLRFDPPPSPHHRFAQSARKLFENAPAEPDGPQVLAGAYRVRLTAGGRSYAQPLTVRNDPATPAADLQARRLQFALAMKAYDAMLVAHQGFLQLARARASLRPLLTSADPDIATLATDIDTRLSTIDGSDWTGLVIPDADNDANEIDEAKEGKHPDFVPPKPVSLSKDYDDPTSILGRAFGNVTHAPAFAILSLTLGDEVTKAGRGTTAPDALAAGNYTEACQQLAGVLDDWHALNSEFLPRLNAELARQKLPLLPIAASVPTISCGAR